MYYSFSNRDFTFNNLTFYNSLIGCVALVFTLGFEMCLPLIRDVLRNDVFYDLFSVKFLPSYFIKLILLIFYMDVCFRSCIQVILLFWRASGPKILSMSNYKAKSN